MEGKRTIANNGSIHQRMTESLKIIILKQIKATRADSRIELPLP